MHLLKAEKPKPRPIALDDIDQFVSYVSETYSLTNLQPAALEETSEDAEEPEIVRERNLHEEVSEKLQEASAGTKLLDEFSGSISTADEHGLEFALKHAKSMHLLADAILAYDKYYVPGSDQRTASELKLAHDSLSSSIVRFERTHNTMRPPCSENCVLRGSAPATLCDISNSERKSLMHQWMANNPTAEQEQRDWKGLYQPLKPWQTRLIELHLPDEERALPFCRLITVDIIDMEGVGITTSAQVVPYMALSYSWGRGKPTSSIMCNDIPLPISEDLAEVMLRLASVEKPTYIWCDGISINQEDNKEKAQQVRNILRIFEKADRVIAWLGEPQDGSVTRNLDAWFNSESSLISSIHGKYHTDLCHETLENIQRNLLDLCRRPWFTRTWVRQEVFATGSLTVQFGPYTIAYEKFLLKLEAWFSLEVILKDGGCLIKPRQSPDCFRKSGFSQTFCTLRKHFKHAGVDEPGYRPPSKIRRYTSHWLQVLQDGVAFDVTDPRDRIYGVLGMVQSPTTKFYVESRDERRSAPLPLSYDKRVSEVYQDFIKHLISSTRSLDILCVFEERRSRASDLPSWVLDWRQDTQRSFIDLPPESAEEQLLPPKFPLSTDSIGHQPGSDKLILLGTARWQKIEIIESIQRRPDVLRALKKGVGHCYPTLSSFDDRLTSILKSGAYVVSALRRAGLSSSIGNLWEPQTSSATTNMHTSTSAVEVLIPKESQVDDILVRFKGAMCLHVLRPLGNREFLLIGPALVVSSKAEISAAHWRETLFLNTNGRPKWLDRAVRSFVLV